MTYSVLRLSFLPVRLLGDFVSVWCNLVCVCTDAMVGKGEANQVTMRHLAIASLVLCPWACNSEMFVAEQTIRISGHSNSRSAKIHN